MSLRVGAIDLEARFLLLKAGDAFDILLGRPWLRIVGAIHDWETDELAIKLGTRKVTKTMSSTSISRNAKPRNMYFLEPQELW